MIRALLRIWVKLTVAVFAIEFTVENQHVRNLQGSPFIIACNHPNTFLDAILISSLFSQKTFYLARGDAFIHPLINRMFLSLGMFPVFNKQDKPNAIQGNNQTFVDSFEILEKGYNLLVFAEGSSKNVQNVRPLSKITPRIALNAWNNEISVAILPVSIHYNHFKGFKKRIHIKIGSTINKEAISFEHGEGYQRNQLNRLLYEQLTTNLRTAEKMASQSSPNRLPQLIGFIAHLPVYYITKGVAYLIANNTAYYDGVLFVSLMVCYPLYLIAIFCLGLVCHPIFYALLPLYPFLAWYGFSFKK